MQIQVSDRMTTQEYDSDYNKSVFIKQHNFIHRHYAHGNLYE